MSEKNELEPEILESLPDDLKKAAKDAPPEVLAAIQRISISQSWSGPLPPPGVFSKYPVAVQKAIVAQADAQMKHRHKIETKVIASNIENSRRGMGFAFWLTLAMFASGVFLLAIDKPVAGLVALFGPAAFHGINFFFQKWREMHEVGKNANDENDKQIEGGRHGKKAVQKTD
jgi:hypothetical protein